MLHQKNSAYLEKSLDLFNGNRFELTLECAKRARSIYAAAGDYPDSRPVKPVIQVLAGLSESTDTAEAISSDDSLDNQDDDNNPVLDS